MPTPTYKALATRTLTSTATSVTFSSIPATYRDLILVVNGAGSTQDNATLTFNGDTTAANYSYVTMRGDGSAATSTSGTGALVATYTTSRFSAIVQIMDYSATDKHKTRLSRDDIASFHARAWVSRWANTAAVTSMVYSAATGNFSIGTTFSLYGVIA
jgi:hypothetical protein